MELHTPPSLLIIEDEPGLHDMLTFGLSKYQLESASSGEEGIEKAKRRRFDLALTDIMMQGMNGVEVIQKLKEVSPETEIIVMTGYPSLETSVASIKGGAYDYIAKPFIMEQLYLVLQKALEKRRMALQLKHSQEMNRIKSEFLFTMSQALNDPIGRILQSSAAMLDGGVLPNEENLKEIRTRAQHLDFLVQNIFKLTDKPLTDSALDWQALIQQLKGATPDPLIKHILLVDDDPAILQLLCYGLAREGLTIETASNGREALEKMALQKPDLMLLDLMLPEMSGFDTLKAMAQNPVLQNVRVVVVTARHLSPRETHQLEERVERIIQKGTANVTEEVIAFLQEGSFQLKEVVLPSAA
ncbi:MAG: response regulator [Elusimicrobiota bacterium]